MCHSFFFLLALPLEHNKMTRNLAPVKVLGIQVIQRGVKSYRRVSLGSMQMRPFPLKDLSILSGIQGKPWRQSQGYPDDYGGNNVQPDYEEQNRHSQSSHLSYPLPRLAGTAAATQTRPLAVLTASGLPSLPLTYMSQYC